MDQQKQQEQKGFLESLYSEEKDYNEAKSNLFGFFKLLVEIDQEKKKGGAPNINKQ